jgi:hypothetical protein
MLPIEPEPLAAMKARFHLAVSEPVDTDKVSKGVIPPPSRDRRHVFDFEDGMRMVVSVDRVIDEEFLHVSASGDEKYAKSIKDEGFEGLVEDVLLRVAALLGRQPGRNLRAFLTESVLHIVFEDGNEGFAAGSQGTGGCQGPCG